MTAHLLDSNILIYVLRGRVPAQKLLRDLAAEGGLYVSVVSRAEILAGMHPCEEAKTLALLNSLATLAIDVPVADRAGRLMYSLARQGRIISFPDALLAATALEHELTLVTNNVRHFAVPNLSVRGLAT